MGDKQELLKARLRDTYYDPERGFRGAVQLAARTNVPEKVALAFLKRQPAAQVFAGPPRRKYKPIIAPDWSYEADLMFMDGRIILCVIEMTSRKAYARIVPSKSARAVQAAFVSIEADFPAKMERLATDDGGEWSLIHRDARTQGTDVRIYTGHGKERNMSLVERFNRTLRSYINKFKEGVTRHWSRYLQSFIRNYNDTIHRTTGMKPNAVTSPVQFAQIRGALLQRMPNPPKHRFAVGDKVRVRIQKNAFAKEGARWSKVVHTIDEVTPTAFVVAGVAYQPYELLPVPAMDEPYKAPERAKKEREAETAEAREKRIARAMRKSGIEPYEETEPLPKRHRPSKRYSEDEWVVRDGQRATPRE